MNTMTLIQTATQTEELLAMPDSDLESWFADAGLAVSVVPHCDAVTCAICFPDFARPAKAA